MDYRFFGSETILRGSELTRYGQVVDLDPADAEALIRVHPPALLLPEELWEKCGITPAELAEFPSATIHGAAPESFRAKTKEVREVFHAYREGLIAVAAKEIAPHAAAVVQNDAPESDGAVKAEPEHQG